MNPSDRLQHPNRNCFPQWMARVKLANQECLLDFPLQRFLACECLVCVPCGGAPIWARRENAAARNRRNINEGIRMWCSEANGPGEKAFDDIMLFLTISYIPPGTFFRKKWIYKFDVHYIVNLCMCTLMLLRVCCSLQSCNYSRAPPHTNLVNLLQPFWRQPVCCIAAPACAS